MSSNATLVVFAKAPMLGFVKTRLAAVIGAEAALDFYRETLRMLLARLSAVRGWRLEIAVTPDDAVGNHALWPDGIERLPQSDGDIGARMERVLAAARPDRPVLVVGSDVPELDSYHLRRACSVLVQHDLVFGPARDGGFWLIGSRRPLPRGFFVAGLVDLAVLDRGVAAEGVADRLRQHLCTVDDEQPADRRVEAAADQVVEQRLGHGGVLAGPLDHAERMLLAGHLSLFHNFVEL